MALDPKKLRVAAIVLALFVGLVLFLLLTTWESPALKSALLSALSSDDLAVDAGRVKLGILRGVVLEDLNLRAKLEDGVATVTAERASLSHNPWGLLRGVVAVDEITLKKPKIEIVWDAPAPPARKGG